MSAVKLFTRRKYDFTNNVKYKYNTATSNHVHQSHRIIDHHWKTLNYVAHNNNDTDSVDPNNDYVH